MRFLISLLFLLTLLFFGEQVGGSSLQRRTRSVLRGRRAQGLTGGPGRTNARRARASIQTPERTARSRASARRSAANLRAGRAAAAALTRPAPTELPPLRRR